MNLEEIKKRYKRAAEAWADNREQALDDIKFARLGEQWPDKVKSQREREARPCLTINRLPGFVRQVVNDARQNTPAIKVHPVDDNSDPETAEVIQGLIRNIEQSSDADTAYDTALEDAVTCGIGFFRVDIDYAREDAFELDILIERINNPLSVIPDPHSTAVDGSDWNEAWLVEEMSHSAFKASYPNEELSSFEGESDGWITEDTIRVCEYWHRKEEDTEIILLADGTVLDKEHYEQHINLFAQIPIQATKPGKRYRITQYIVSGSGVIEENPWQGKFIPICPCYGDEIVVEEKRYFQSLTRQAKDAQRNFNYWRTSATERVALANKVPWVGPVGAFDTDIRKWETANTDAHPFIEFDGPVPPQQTMPSMVDAGSMQEAMNAADDLKSIMGLYDASLGARSNETSGRAILARQKEGDVSTYHFIDNLSRAIKYAGRVVLDLIPHVYTQPRIVRTLGYDNTVNTVQINQEFDTNGMAKIHDLTKGKYDLTVEAGPSYSTKREESATQMVEMLRSFPQAAPIIGDLVAKNLDWPGADEIAKRLKTMLPPQIQALEKLDGLPPEAQAAMAQSQAQIKQLMDIIEQGKGLLQEKDQQIKEFEIAQNSKVADIQAKEADSQRKYEAQLAKIQADLQIAELKAREDQRETVLDTVMEGLKQRMELLTKVQEGTDTNTAQLSEQLNAVAENLSAQVEAQKDKVIEIAAPSGRTYRGAVKDGEIAIETPSGEVYNGIVEER